MASKLQIINLGLGLISQRTIVDTTELTANTTAQAVAANAVWDVSLAEALRGHNWSFASTVLALVTSTYSSLSYQYSYVYPAAAMNIWKVYGASTANLKKGEDFRELYDSVNALKVIVTNCYQAYAEFTYLVTDTTLYDSYFVNTLAARLAAAFAMPLNADPEQAKELIKTYNFMLSEAQRLSSGENNIKNGQDPEMFSNARMSGNSGIDSVSIGGTTFPIWNG